MAGLDRLEGDAIEGVSLLVLLSLLGLVVLGLLAWKDFSLPGWAYPDQLWGTFSTGVDKLMEKTEISGTNWSESINNWLASVFEWITKNLPNVPISKNAGSAPATTIATGPTAPDQAQVVDPDPYGEAAYATMANVTIPDEPIEQLNVPGFYTDPWAGLPPVQLPQIGGQ